MSYAKAGTATLIAVLFLLVMQTSALSKTLSRAGIGMGINIEGNKSIDEHIQVSGAHPLKVVHLVKDCPAENAGMKIGDQVTKVDGKSVAGMTIADVIDQVMGQKGTPVQITFLRTDGRGRSVEQTVSVTRLKQFCVNRMPSSVK